MTVGMLFALVAAGVLVATVALLVIAVARPCPRCGDTGVLKTGNNDLPCDCRAGDRARFNVSGAAGMTQKTGAELRRRWDDVP